MAEHLSSVKGITCSIRSDADMSSPIHLARSLPSPDAIEALLEKRSKNKFYSMFPDEGPLARSGYTRHLEFVASTKVCNETLFCSANKVGKTQMGGFMTTAFATGDYPDWWPGRKFDEPVYGWSCNSTAEKVKRINQKVLLGPPHAIGTGMIPAHRIIDVRPKPGVPDGVSTIFVRHVSGGQSMIDFKSYDQKRKAFEADNVDFIWDDEEVDDDIYTEQVLRIMTTSGLIFCTYTPVMGMTPVTVSYLRNAINKSSLPIHMEDDGVEK